MRSGHLAMVRPAVRRDAPPTLVGGAARRYQDILISM